MIRGWRLWTWWARRREERKEGWTPAAIQADLDRQAERHDGPDTGRHRLERQP